MLSSANARWTVERVGDGAFVLRADRPGWLGNMFSRLVRTSPQIPPGPYAMEPFTATVVERTAGGDDVLAVRFDVTGDPLLLVWTGEGYAPVDLETLPLGEPVPITDSADVWASMM